MREREDLLWKLHKSCRPARPVKNWLAASYSTVNSRICKCIQPSGITQITKVELGRFSVLCVLCSVLLYSAELAGGARGGGGGGGMTHLYLFIVEEMIVDSMESSRKKDRFKESFMNEIRKSLNRYTLDVQDAEPEKYYEKHKHNRTDNVMGSSMK